MKIHMYEIRIFMVCAGGHSLVSLYRRQLCKDMQDINTLHLHKHDHSCEQTQHVGTDMLACTHAHTHTYTHTHTHPQRERERERERFTRAHAHTHTHTHTRTVSETDREKRKTFNETTLKTTLHSSKLSKPADRTQGPMPTHPHPVQTPISGGHNSRNDNPN